MAIFIIKSEKQLWFQHTKNDFLQFCNGTQYFNTSQICSLWHIISNGSSRFLRCPDRHGSVFPQGFVLAAVVGNNVVTPRYAHGPIQSG